MNNKFKIILGFFLIVIVGLIIMMNYYNKPHVNVKQIKADYKLTSQNLINAYEKDEVETNKKYSEKIIEVKGEIHKISTLKGATVITLKEKNMGSSIICYMLPEENMKSLNFKIGQNIYIRGICTGYLLDVIMVKCIFVD